MIPKKPEEAVVSGTVPGASRSSSQMQRFFRETQRARRVAVEPVVTKVRELKEAGERALTDEQRN